MLGDALPCSMGKSTISTGPCSIAMSQITREYIHIFHIYIYIYIFHIYIFHIYSIYIPYIYIPHIFHIYSIYIPYIFHIYLYIPYIYIYIHIYIYIYIPYIFHIYIIYIPYIYIYSVYILCIYIYRPYVSLPEGRVWALPHHLVSTAFWVLIACRFTGDYEKLSKSDIYMHACMYVCMYPTSKTHCNPWPQNTFSFSRMVLKPA